MINTDAIAFAEMILKMVRNYEKVCQQGHAEMKDKCGPYSTAALVMDAKRDTAETLGNEIEAELELLRLGIPPVRATKTPERGNHQPQVWESTL